MKKTGVIFVSLLLLAYFISLYYKFNQLSIPVWVNNYFADLLCLPILLSITLMLMRKFLRKANFLFSPLMVFFVWAYVSFVFEFLLPTISFSYTADPTDVFMYGIGGFSFWLLQRPLFIKKQVRL